MAFNLFIAYDLMQPGQNYDAVRDTIRSLGKHAQLQFSLFYVHSPYDAQTAHQLVRTVMDPNDKLVVIEALKAHVSQYPDQLLNAINGVWDLP